jgi:hypothetical protein
MGKHVKRVRGGFATTIIFGAALLVTDIPKALDQADKSFAFIAKSLGIANPPEHFVSLAWQHPWVVTLAFAIVFALGIVLSWCADCLIRGRLHEPPPAAAFHYDDLQASSQPLPTSLAGAFTKIAQSIHGYPHENLPPMRAAQPRIAGGLVSVEDHISGLTSVWLKIENPNQSKMVGLRASLKSSNPALSGYGQLATLPATLATKTRLERARSGIETLPDCRFDLGPYEIDQVEVFRATTGKTLEGWTTHEGGEMHYRLYQDQTLTVEVTGSGVPIVAHIAITIGPNSMWFVGLTIAGVGESHVSR